MGFLATMFSSILSGGVTGILGVVVQRFADYKNKQLDITLNKQKLDQEIALREADAKVAAAEWSARTEIVSIKESAAEARGENTTFAASFNEPSLSNYDIKPSPSQAWLLITLDFIRGIVRPGLTIYLCVLTTMLYFSARDLMGGSITPEKASDLLMQITNTILYLATSCVMWWFGTRNRQKAPTLAD